LKVDVVDDEGNIIGTAITDPASVGWPTGVWRAGEVAALRALPVIDPDYSGGGASLRLTWLGEADDSRFSPIELHELAVQPLSPIGLRVPDEPYPTLAVLGDAAELLDVKIAGDSKSVAGSQLSVTAFWHARQPLTVPYSVLVHLVDADGDVVAQADGQPVGGSRPATSWRRGELIEDEHILRVPDGLAAGDYALLFGMYDSSQLGYPRLRVSSGSGAGGDDRVPVGSVEIWE
jgi:hypothetical protein